jgi:hypothetical protein
LIGAGGFIQTVEQLGKALHGLPSLLL